MDTVRSVEESLAQDVDALRDQFTETQTLYREVCALLFFRYGMTPTANKLYQLVRKGSMSAPAQALAQFWTDLREKSRNRVEHPDLPPEFQALGENWLRDSGKLHNVLQMSR
ncbi:DNA-binding protein [Orrella marina]|uniref:DNA-binding protein n=1 Tax=Orrella marina TaxID=2163011 RepID=UPI00131EFA0A|nr:DNA-binding protein [Orrella marina]